MPIRPENRARYPKDWKRISASIRQRAQDRCEWPGCGARQYAVGHWEQRNGLWQWVPLAGNGPCDAAGQGMHWPGLQPWTHADAKQFAAELDWSQGEEGHKPIVIVLTVAHLDHVPEHCDPENLRAWCQRHHLAYDHEHHQANAQQSRRARLAVADLFA